MLPFPASDTGGGEAALFAAEESHLVSSFVISHTLMGLGSSTPLSPAPWQIHLHDSPNSP